jgi:integrase
MTRPDAYRMIRRRARQAGIKTQIGNHSMRATGITAYLKNGSKREYAQEMAAHSSPRKTELYDRSDEEVALEDTKGLE